MTGGSSWYGLRPGNSLGAIRLSARKNKNLVETTAREGLVRNESYRIFTLLLHALLKEINDLFIEKIRRSLNSYQEYKLQKKVSDNKSITNEEWSSLEKQSKEQKQIVEDIGKAEQRIEVQLFELDKKGPLLSTQEEKNARIALQETKKVLYETKKAIQPVANILARIAPEKELLDSRVQIMEDEMSILFELASLGMVAEVLSHEISQIVSSLALRSKTILDQLAKGNDSQPQMLAYAEHVNAAVGALRKQISHLSPSLRYVREQKNQIEILPFLKDLVSFHEKRLDSKGIGIEILPESISFSVKVNRGRLTQVLDNLINNSEYWLLSRFKNESNFKPRISIQLRNQSVYLWDNGFGIEKHLEHQVFQPFITMKPKGQGRGLGLYICDKLLESVGGTISLLQERNEYGNRFKFEIDLSGIK